MANKSRAIRAARAFVEIFADDSKLVSGLRRAQARLKHFGNAVRNMGMRITAVGSLIVAPLLAAAKSFSTIGDDIAKMAKRTGISVEAISALRHAADQSATSIDTIERSLRRMARTIGYARQGLTTGIRALDQLGLSLAEVQDLMPEDQFRLIAERIRQIENPTLRASAAMEVFGRAGTELLPLIMDNVDELMKEAERLNLVVSAADAKSAEELNDAFGRVSMSVQMAVFRIGGALAPILTSVSNKIAAVSAAIGKFITENRGLIVSIAKMAAILVGAGVAITALGIAIAKAALVFSILIGVAKVIFIALTAVKVIALALVSPIGIVTVAIAGIAFQALKAAGVIKRVVDNIKSRFQDLSSDMGEVLSDIAERIAAGDITGAAKVAFEGLRLAWAHVMHAIETLFDKVKRRLAEAWHRLTYAISDIWAILGERISTIWHGIIKFFKTSLSKFQGWLAKQFIKIQGLWDDTLDVDTAINLIDEDTKREVQSIEEEYAAKKKANQDALNDELNANKRVFDARMAAVKKLQDEEIAEIDARLAAAKAEYELALQAIRKRKKAADDERKGYMEHVTKLQQLLTLGTFQIANTLALSAVSGNDEKQIALLEDIERNTRQEVGGIIPQ